MAEDSDSEMSGWGLLVSFTDASASFTNGFEAGQVWERMTNTLPTITLCGHAENAEVYSRMATHHGYTVSATPTSAPGWTDFEFTKSRKTLERPAPHLSVVS